MTSVIHREASQYGRALCRNCCNSSCQHANSIHSINQACNPKRVPPHLDRSLDTSYCLQRCREKLLHFWHSPSHTDIYCMTCLVPTVQLCCHNLPSCCWVKIAAEVMNILDYRWLHKQQHKVGTSITTTNSRSRHPQHATETVPFHASSLQSLRSSLPLTQITEKPDYGTRNIQTKNFQHVLRPYSQHPKSSAETQSQYLGYLRHCPPF